MIDRLEEIVASGYSPPGGEGAWWADLAVEGDMRPFSDLAVWQQAHALVLEVYRVTRRYPREELFGLTAQTRRAAASVPANIAEGCGKRTLAQLRFTLDVAGGSLSELEYWLMLGGDLGYVSGPEFDARYAELNDVRRLLLGLAAWSRR